MTLTMAHRRLSIVRRSAAMMAAFDATDRGSATVSAAKWTIPLHWRGGGGARLADDRAEARGAVRPRCLGRGTEHVHRRPIGARRSGVGPPRFERHRRSGADDA